MAFTPGKSLNLPKTKNLFLSLSLLSLSDKPPHFTPAQPPDGKSSAVSLPLGFVDHWCFGAVPANNDFGQQIPAFEVGSRLCTVPDLAAPLFVSTLLVWKARGQVCSVLFDVRGSFDDLI